MTQADWYPIENIDRNCFACGQDNHHGLNMTFKTNGKQVRSRVTIPSHHRGWSNLAHGGILATMTDEIMSWTAIHLFKRFILTKQMTISYLRPVRIGTTITVTGSIKEHKHERSAIMKADIQDEKGNLCATGEGDFVLFTPEQFSMMNLLPREDMEQMIAQFKK